MQYRLYSLYYYNAGFHGHSIPREYCELKVSWQNTKLAMLLPSERDLGLCSYGMVHYLADLQNNFRNTYLQLSPQER